MKPMWPFMALAKALHASGTLRTHGPWLARMSGGWALCTCAGQRGKAASTVLSLHQDLWVMVFMSAILLLGIVLAAILRSRLREHTGTMREWLRREAALRKQYFDLFENSTDATYTHDLDYRITSWNHAAERLTGFTRDEILGKRISDLLPPELVERMTEMTRRKLQGHPITQYEIELVAKDGSRVPVEVTSRLVEEEGKVVGIQGAARDIGERKRAQEALRRRDAILEAVSFAAQRLLLAPDWKEAIESVLARLGQAMGVTRGHIFENHRGRNDSRR